MKKKLDGDELRSFNFFCDFRCYKDRMAYRKIYEEISGRNSLNKELEYIKWWAVLLVSTDAKVNEKAHGRTWCIRYAIGFDCLSKNGSMA